MVDFGWLGQISFDWQFFAASMSMVMIDRVLAGDNAVVIAMAVRNLPHKKRLWGIALGSGAAVVVRVIATFLVAQLLNMPFIKLVGGAAIIWIAVKLLTEGSEENHEDCECGTIWKAIWIIIVADMSMGIDNMLAVGAASHGNLFLLLFGLFLSIPFVVFMSNLLAKMMNRYPIILWFGAGILGKVGGEMMITDPWISGLLHAPRWVEYAVMVFFIVFVCGLGKGIANRRKAAMFRRENNITDSAMSCGDGAVLSNFNSEMEKKS